MILVRDRDTLQNYVETLISIKRNTRSTVHLDLLQVSLLINKQTGGKKKKTEEIRGGMQDLWTTCSENETGQDLDRRLSFMLAEEPIKFEQVNKSLVFGALSSPPPFPSVFFFFFPPVCLLINSETWSKSTVH